MTVRSGCDGLSTIDLIPIVLVIGTFIIFIGRLIIHSISSRRID